MCFYVHSLERCSEIWWKRKDLVKSIQNVYGAIKRKFSLVWTKPATIHDSNRNLALFWGLLWYKPSEPNKNHVVFASMHTIVPLGIHCTWILLDCIVFVQSVFSLNYNSGDDNKECLMRICLWSEWGNPMNVSCSTERTAWSVDEWNSLEFTQTRCNWEMLKRAEILI